MTYNLTLDEMERRYGALWRFATKRFTVAFWAEEELDAPEDPEDIAAVREGAVDWFCAFVGVFKDGQLIGSDSLGGCAYDSARSFAESPNRDRYFRDMVRQALNEARAHELRLQFTA